MQIGNSLNFPTYLEAKTAEELSAAMLQNNLAYSTEFHYFDIQFVKGKWYAWYKRDHTGDLKNTKRAE